MSQAGIIWLLGTDLMLRGAFVVSIIRLAGRLCLFLALRQGRVIFHPCFVCASTSIFLFED